MRDLIILFVHVIVTICRLLRPSGARSVIAESILLKQQLLILNRSRKRAPNLRASDRFIAGVCSLFMKSSRLIRSAIVLKPSTLLSIHHALRNRKYRFLFSQKRAQKPGPHGPSKELIDAIVDTKRRNPTWGCPRIAEPKKTSGASGDESQAIPLRPQRAAPSSAEKGEPIMNGCSHEINGQNDGQGCKFTV
jgi:putative transposase